VSTEFDLLPFEIGNLGHPQAVPEGDEEFGFREKLGKEGNAMKHSWMVTTSIAAALIAGCNASQTAIAQQAKPEIVHDSEYYILATQHGEQWAAEDQEINRKLAELRQKYGTPPNIVHIMWDDTAVGEVGIPAIQKVRGF
jgi:arylsulfatase